MRLLLLALAFVPTAASSQTLPAPALPAPVPPAPIAPVPAGPVTPRAAPATVAWDGRQSDAPSLVFLLQGERVNLRGRAFSDEEDVVAYEVLGPSDPRRPSGYDAAVNAWLHPDAARRLGLPVVAFRLDGRRVAADRLRALPCPYLAATAVRPARTVRTWWGARRARLAEVSVRCAPHRPASAP